MGVEHLVVMGASAGGIDALRQILRDLPATIQAAICIVVHISPESPGALPDILSRAGPLPVEQVDARRKLEHGRIYVAPPDHHILIEPERVRASRGPQELRFRPAVDPLFRSAAQVYGPRVIGVVLSGNLDDGTSGLWAIKRLGGVAIVQDPSDAAFPSMPAHAAAHVTVDYSLPVTDIGTALVRLTSMPVQDRAWPAEGALDIEVEIAGGTDARDAGVERLGPPSGFSCPECHGVLLELQEGNRRRFRCHTGHSHSTASLAAALNEEIDRSLWIGIRTLDEAGRIMTHMSTHADAEGNRLHFARKAKEALDDADTLRTVAARRGRSGEK